MNTLSENKEEEEEEIPNPRIEEIARRKGLTERMQVKRIGIRVEEKGFGTVVVAVVDGGGGAERVCDWIGA